MTAITLPPVRMRLSPNRSSRRNQPVHLVVVHDTEGSYDGACAWLRNPRSEASAHVVLREDGAEAVQLVPWHEKAWSCEAFNSVSDNLELAGFAAQGYSSHQLAVAARIVAFRCHRRDIPPVWSRNPMSEPGIVRHSDLGLIGGGHHDPGLGWLAWRRFIRAVQAECKRGGFREHWGS